MLRRLFTPALATVLLLAACELPSTGPTAATLGEDYALAMFGEPGTALEGTMGPHVGPRPFDGRTGRPPLPDSLKLSDEQRAEMDSIRAAFRTANEEALDSLRDIFQEARTARMAGASREEVRAILETGRPIAQALRPAVIALHEALRAVLTDAQRAWIETHRPRRFPRPMAGP